jgi:hypothetical protein
MEDALRVRTKVLPGRRIEVTDPALVVGDAVEVVVLPQASPPAGEKRYSMLELVESLNGRRHFQTAEGVNAYIRAERDSWER